MITIWMIGRRYKSIALGWVVAACWIACMFDSRSSANAQVVLPFQPRPQSVSLHTNKFVRRISEGSIILGTIQKTGFTGEQRVNNWHHPPVHQIWIHIRVERTVLGKVPEDSVLKCPAHWIDLRHWQSMLGENRPPAAGDRVLYQYVPSDKPDELPVFGGPTLAPAYEEEVKRLDRIAEIVEEEDAALAARWVLDGCFDPDPHFAVWCLDVSDTSDRDNNEPFITAYGDIRSQISVAQNLKTCWKLLQRRGTHSLVYERADSRLVREELEETEQWRRHTCHQQRFRDLIQDPPASEHARYYSEQELQYLLHAAYPKMPLECRLEALDQLREMGRSRNSVLRNEAVRYASRLYEPGDERSQREVYAFYHEFLPLRNEDDYFLSWFQSGLKIAMEKESQASGKISHAGVSMLEKMILLGDEKCAFQSASSLAGYIRFCRREEVEWPDLPQFLRVLIATTPHRKVKALFKETARILEIPLEMEVEAL